MLISVVIPVYNGENVIRRSVESVLPQMGADIEMVLVDDGSVDKSGLICDEYAGKHDHIHVVHKANGGISSARNAAIQVAKGEYLMFLDADDYLDPDTIGQISDVIRIHHPDLIDFGWKLVRQSGEMTQIHHKLPKDTLLDAHMIQRDILPPLLNLCYDPDRFVFDYVWNKVFRRDMIENNKLSFDEGRRIWEDRPFVVQYLKYCSTYYSMERCCYGYVAAEGSLSRRFSPEFFRIILENYQLYKKLYGSECDFDTAYVNGYWSRSIEKIVFRILEDNQLYKQYRRDILDVFCNEQVVYWFAHRSPESAFDKQISRLLVSQEAEVALRTYRRQNIVQHVTEQGKQLMKRMKRIVRKLIRR